MREDSILAFPAHTSRQEAIERRAALGFGIVLLAVILPLDRIAESIGHKWEELPIEQKGIAIALGVATVVTILAVLPP